MTKLDELKLLILAQHNNIKALWEQWNDMSDTEECVRKAQKYTGVIEGILLTASLLLTEEEFEKLQNYERLLQNKPNF